MLVRVRLSVRVPRFIIRLKIKAGTPVFGLVVLTSILQPKSLGFRMQSWARWARGQLG